MSTFNLETPMPFTGYIMIFNPDGLLMALFVGDGDQEVPTQHTAVLQYWLHNCSPFCYYEQHQTVSVITSGK